MISDRFRTLRHELALSQEKFGERLGVYRSAILNIELNKVAPRRVFIDHVCEVFHVNSEWLLEGIGEMFLADRPDNNLMNELLELCRKLRPEYQVIMLQHANTYLDLQRRQEAAAGRRADAEPLFGRSSGMKIAEESAPGAGVCEKKTAL